MNTIEKSFRDIVAGSKVRRLPEYEDDYWLTFFESGKILEVKTIVDGALCFGTSDRDGVWDAYRFELIREEPKVVTNEEQKADPNRRPHADLIIEWANGAEIEYLSPSLGTWEPAVSPIIWHKDSKYRIKQKQTTEKRLTFVEMVPCLDNAFDDPNLELTFDKTVW